MLDANGGASLSSVVSRVKRMSHTFTLRFHRSRSNYDYLSLDLGGVVVPLMIERPVEDIIRDLEAGIAELEHRERGEVIIHLKGDAKAEIVVQREGAICQFRIVSRQVNDLAPNDGKIRFRVSELLPFEKLKLRVRKGIDYFTRGLEAKNG